MSVVGKLEVLQSPHADLSKKFMATSAAYGAAEVVFCRTTCVCQPLNVMCGSLSSKCLVLDCAAVPKARRASAALQASDGV